MQAVFPSRTDPDISKPAKLYPNTVANICPDRMVLAKVIAVTTGLSNEKIAVIECICMRPVALCWDVITAGPMTPGKAVLEIPHKTEVSLVHLVLSHAVRPNLPVGESDECPNVAPKMLMWAPEVGLLPGDIILRRKSSYVTMLVNVVSWFARVTTELFSVYDPLGILTIRFVSLIHWVFSVAEPPMRDGGENMLVANPSPDKTVVIDPVVGTFRRERSTLRGPS